MRDHGPAEVESRSELIHELLDEAAAQVPDRRAVTDSDGSWTYRELNSYSHAFATWLLSQGVGRGDRIVLQLPTSRRMAAMFYGASRVGAVFVPLNPAMKGYHLNQVVPDARPKVVITDTEGVARFADSTPAPVFELDRVWAELGLFLAPDGSAAWSESTPVCGADILTLIYTSGSTAAPKGVICPQAQVTFATWALTEALGYRADDVVFCRFPMSWDYGLYKVVMACAARCEIVVADGESDLVLLERMRETGATIVPIVPSLAAMIIQLCARDSSRLPPVRMFTNTGAALPQTTSDALREYFPDVRVVRQYGQTEAKRITVMPPEQDRERPGSSGLPLPRTQVLILDDDGHPLPAGQVGEIVAVGPHVMPGYWHQPELTATTFRPDPGTGGLRLHTGDYGSLDEDGYLYFQGRRDDMFKSKGFRMSTLEIEAATMDIPGVRAAAALPPSEEHELALFVEADLTARQIIKELRQRLEPAKVPAFCQVLGEFPLTLNGKSARDELAALRERATR